MVALLGFPLTLTLHESHPGMLGLLSDTVIVPEFIESFEAAAVAEDDVREDAIFDTTDEDDPCVEFLSASLIVCSRRAGDDENVDNNDDDDDDDDDAGDDDEGADDCDAELELLVGAVWNGFAENSLFIAIGTMSSSKFKPSVCLADFTEFGFGSSVIDTSQLMLLDLVFWAWVELGAGLLLGLRLMLETEHGSP